MTINEFIGRECPFVIKGGFECLEYEGFLYASIGVSHYTLSKFLKSIWDWNLHHSDFRLITSLLLYTWVNKDSTAIERLIYCSYIYREGK